MFRSSISYAVIGAVAKQRDLSIQALHKLLTDKGVNISLPNFYKIIAHMIDDQILIKPNGRVQLHALFMRYIFGLTEDSQKSYLADDSNSIQKLQVGQQETWEEANLYDLNVIRMDLLGQLTKSHPGERSYHYTSHPYYLLSEPEKEISSLEDVATGDKKSYFLIGNTTFLDKHATEMLSKEYFLAKCKNDTPFPEQ